MPAFREIEVYITNEEYEPLKEYGTRSHKHQQLCSTFVESKTDTPFRVSVTPRPELCEFEDSDAEEDVVDCLGKTWTIPRDRRTRIDNQAATHMIAELYLDGSKTCEKRAHVPLYNHLKDATDEQRRAVMRCRYYVEGGNDMVCGWVFKDVGVENFFAKLDISNPDLADQVSTQEVEDLTSAVEDTGVDTAAGTTQGGTKVGCTEVIIRRITIDEMIYNDSVPDDDTLDESEPTFGLSDKVSHTAGRTAGIVKGRTTNTCMYTEVDKDKIYAKFRFYYRSGDVLGKMFGPKKSLPLEKEKALKVKKRGLATGNADEVKKARFGDEDR